MEPSQFLLGREARFSLAMWTRYQGISRLGGVDKVYRRNTVGDVAGWNLELGT